MKHEEKKKLNIGIMDADLLERKNHRFPNLVCEKISGYYKKVHNAKVTLLMDYNSFEKYDYVHISKVFTNTPIPKWLVKFIDGKYVGATYDAEKPKWFKNKKKPKIRIGGTGIYFDKAPALLDKVEHCMPDYDLYNDWIKSELKKAAIQAELEGDDFDEKKFLVPYKEYLEYSIGFLTRGCFRKCKFCVNQKYNHSFIASNLKEFYDKKRKKICLLDDNFLSSSNWKELLLELIAIKKPFKFKQGLDERLLTEEKCKLLFNSNYDGDFTFAFDNVKDYELIHSKLKMIRKISKSKGIMFYVLVGFESTGIRDIENAFKRIALLMQYRCLPYIMRYMSPTDAPWEKSKYRDVYVTLARWCNQPNIFKKMSFKEFCVANQKLHRSKDSVCSSMRAYLRLKENAPKLVDKYCNLRFAKKI